MRSLNFGPNQINNPYNAFTLVSGLYVAFDKLLIALESTDTLGTYRIRKFGRLPGEASLMLPKSDTVTLSGIDQIPAPHPILLQVNAAVAQILHLTAMAETIENVLRDRELVLCLAIDGSTNVEYLLMAF
ncbi:hypothetical protein MMC31_006299 [Peltigera leucophlebia]|nr:hypothetical protein [Peltigera leucophlebia]